MYLIVVEMFRKTARRLFRSWTISTLENPCWLNTGNYKLNFTDGHMRKSDPSHARIRNN